MAPLIERRRRDGGMTRGESEKKGFAFPRTKHSLAPLVLSTLPSLSSRFSFQCEVPSPLPPSLHLLPLLLLFLLKQYSFLSSFLTCSLFPSLSLSLFLFCWSYSSSSRFIAMCSLPRKLVHSSSSLACSPFLPSLFSLSLYSSCRLIKPVDLPSHLSPPRHRDLWTGVFALTIPGYTSEFVKFRS